MRYMTRSTTVPLADQLFQLEEDVPAIDGGTLTALELDEYVRLMRRCNKHKIAHRWTRRNEQRLRVLQGMATTEETKIAWRLVQYPISIVS